MKRVTFSPAEEIWRRLTRTVVLGLLKPWSASDIQFAIENDIMLATLVKADTKHYHTLRRIAGNTPKWAHVFTTEYVMEWVIDNRKDFATILTAEPGKKWLDANIKALRDLVWGEEATLTEAERQQLLALAEKWQKEA